MPAATDSGSPARRTLGRAAAWLGEQCNPARCALAAACCYLVSLAVFRYQGMWLAGFAACAAVALLARPHAKIVEPASPLGWAVAIFAAASALSAATSVDELRSLRLGAPILPALVLFAAIARGRLASREIAALYAALALFAAALAAALLRLATSIPQAAHLNAAVTHAGVAALIVPNDVACAAILAPLGLAWAVARAGCARCMLAGVWLAVTAAAIAASASRTGLAALAVGLATGVWLSPRPVRTRMAAACLPAVLALVVMGSGNAAVLPGEPLAAKIAQAGANGRLDDWARAWALFTAAPLLGHGLGSFGLFHHPPWPHNVYLEVLAERGLVGLASLVALAAAAAAAARSALGNADPTVRVLAAGAVGALAALAAAATVDLTLAREWVVIVAVLLLAAIDRLAARSARQGAPS